MSMNEYYCKGPDQKPCKKIPYKDGYCKKHQKYAIRDKALKEGKKICSQFKRGCKNILEETYEKKWCPECLEKDRKKSKIIKSNKEKKSKQKLKSKTDKGTNYQICNSCKNVRKKKYFVGDKGQETKTCKNCRNNGKVADKNRSGRIDKKMNVATHIYDYKKKCKNDEIPMKLSYAQMEFMIMYSKCHYCYKYSDNKKLIGIDRLDPNIKIGYTINNCVPCCEMCNRIKRLLPYKIFLKMCTQIVSNLKIWDIESNKNIIPDKIAVKFSGAIGDTKKKNEERCIEFKLSKDEFYAIKQNNCYLCGKENSEDHLNGIDRVVNTKSYTINNCKSCCGTCNIMKGKYDLRNFIRQVVRIAILNNKEVRREYNKDYRSYIKDNRIPVLSFEEFEYCFFLRKIIKKKISKTFIKDLTKKYNSYNVIESQKKLILKVLKEQQDRNTKAYKLKNEK